MIIAPTNIMVFFLFADKKTEINKEKTKDVYTEVSKSASAWKL